MCPRNWAPLPLIPHLTMCVYMFQNGMYVFHLCIFLNYLQVRVFLLDASHRPWHMQDWTVDSASFLGQSESQRCFLSTQDQHCFPVLMPWASLFQARHRLLSSKQHCLGDIIFTKHVSFFQRALLRRRSLSRGICQALSGEQESFQSVGWAWGRWDIFQALGENKAP